jgi:hypothetical protein
VRVDPSSGEIVDTVPLEDEGPIAAHGSRVAFSDTSTLHVDDDATDSHVQIPIRDAVGHENMEITDPNRSAIFGFTGVALGPDGLFGKYAKGNELVQMDPATGAHVATHVVEDVGEPIGPVLAASDGYLWSPGATTVYGVATPISTPPNLPAERRVDVGAAVSDLAPFDGGRFVALLASQAVLGGDPGREDLRTTLDPAANGRIVEDHGRPWVAQWSSFAEGPTTMVSFVRVRTDDSMPAGAPPATAPPPFLTVMASDPLRDGEEVPIVAAGLPGGAAVTLRVCLAQDPVGPEPCRHSVEPNPLPTAHAGNMAGFGELLTEWTAQRGIYDGRWHDCAMEACVLRLYATDAEGRRDASALLAEAPLTFAAEGSLPRPTLTLIGVGPVVTVGSTVRVRGEGFPAGATGINIGLCATGGYYTTCRYDMAAVNQTVDGDGDVVVAISIQTSTITLPDGEVIDCAAAPGTCSLSVFPDQHAEEPYVTVALELG